MAQKQDDTLNPMAMFESFMEQAGRLWMDGTEKKGSSSKKKSEKTDADNSAFNPWGAWEPTLDIWKTMQSGYAGDSISDPFKMVREESLKQWQKMSSTGWENIAGAGSGVGGIPEWLAQASMPGGESFFGGRDTIQNLLKLMAGEISRLASVPALGISRNYHEKMVGVVEKSNQFLLTLSEYLFMMFTPLEGASKIFQETVQGASGTDGQPWSPDAMYEMWLAELEKGYFTLYSSEEYLTLLKRVIESMGEYNLARQTFVGDSLKFYGIPSESDLDDLYRDLYEMKKRIADLEQQINAGS